ncbi:MAG: response regulator [Syntrophobacteraceae bacterium]
MGNILVVDDERGIRFTVKAFLEADGHSVETAEAPEAALAVIESKPIDVVLTDIILPGMSGVDLFRKIRERSPHTQVVMMTGEPTLETASESLRLGAIDYLQKPTGKTEILKVVRNALHVKHLIDEKQRLEEENLITLSHLEQQVEARTRALAASEEALRNRADELAILNRLAREVNESLLVDDVVRCGLREIAQASSPDLAILFLRRGDDLVAKGSITGRQEIAWGAPEPHRVGRCLCGLAVADDKAIYSSDIRSDSRCTMEECRDSGFRSFAALPLRSGSEIIGVLGIASLTPHDFEKRGAFLEALANELSIGLKKSLLYEQVRLHATELKASLSRIEEGEAERLVLERHLQLSQKMEAIGTLASGIAHDFNNILGAVFGYTELALLHGSNEAKVRQYLNLVLTAGERAKDLVQQILSFGQQGDDEKKPIQIDHILKEVLKFLRASLPATIEIRRNIGSDIGNILADPVQIHQVLMNLCTNAHHAMSEQGGVLEISLSPENLGPECTAIHPDLESGPYVRLSVKDTGHGMDEETLSRIFDPYFTTKEKGVGTGLGLAVVHRIVQKHGGVITVTSAPGKGSAFNLYFPVIQKEAVSEARAPADLPTGNERILFVDDDLVLVEIGRQMLESMGYRVETRTSSIDALSLFKARPHSFDVVITDMTMPNMTGEKLAIELMRVRMDIPIVLCTGYSEKMMEHRAKAIGIRTIVLKPILMANLATAVRTALEGTARE